MCILNSLFGWFRNKKIFPTYNDMEQGKRRIRMASYEAFQGVILQIDHMRTGTFGRDGCNKMMLLEDPQGNQFNFIVQPMTYFLNQEPFDIGDRVIGFYDADEPAITIYPPQRRAIAMARVITNQNVNSATGTVRIYLTRE